MINAAEVRAKSKEVSERFGCAVPTMLPLLDHGLRLRDKTEIEDRALVMHAVVAASFGFDRRRALEWITANVGLSRLAESGRIFLNAGQNDRGRLRTQVEALCAFAWALRKLDTLDFMIQCPDTLRRLYPDLKIGESPKRFRETGQLRSFQEIFDQCDLAYCLHWCVKDAMLKGDRLSSSVVPQVIIERRRALDWMLASENWDEMSLDT